MSAQINPGEGYRLVNEGEMLHADDEILLKDVYTGGAHPRDSWSRQPAATGVFDPLRAALCFVRRRVNAVPQPGDKITVKVKIGRKTKTIEGTVESFVLEKPERKLVPPPGFAEGGVVLPFIKSADSAFKLSSLPRPPRPEGLFGSLFMDLLREEMKKQGTPLAVTPRAPSYAGDGYRFVEVGEGLSKGDEIFDHRGQRWERISDSSNVFGHRVKDASSSVLTFGWYRRRKAEASKPAHDGKPSSPGDGYRFLTVGEYLVASDEVCMGNEKTGWHKVGVPLHGERVNETGNQCPVGWYRRAVIRPPKPRTGSILRSVKGGKR